jgi:FkbM family methyltransferase
MSQTQCVSQQSIPVESIRGWRRVARDVVVACLASQPVTLKLWEMRHFRRLILGTLFRLERAAITTVAAGPAGQRFRMRLRWRAHMSYVLGLYEIDLIRVLEQHLRPGDTCMDLGAHVGYVTMLMARGVGPQGRVISFEPVPETYNALRENIRLNGYDNVTTEAAAAGDRQGSIDLVCTKGQELSWTASALAYSQPGEEDHITVPVVKLDDYVQRNGLRPKLIKVDVEGAELAVLQGGRQTLRKIRPVVLVEIHDLGPSHKAQVLHLLREHDYAVNEVQTREREVLCLAVPHNEYRVCSCGCSGDLFIFSHRSAGSLGLGDHFFGNLVGHVVIVRKLHVIAGPALGHGGQVVGVAEHLREWHLRFDHHVVAASFAPADPSATGTQITHNVAGILVRGVHFDVHDGFEQRGPGLLHAFLKRQTAGDLEGHIRGVHIVVLAVI